MKKRLVCLCVIFCLFTLTLAPLSYADDNKCVFLYNGEDTNIFDITQNNGVYMISTSSIKSLGVENYEYAGGNKIAFSNGGTFVVAEIGSNTYYKNGTANELPVAPYVSNGNCYVPLENIVKALGFQVKFTQDGESCNIYKASDVENAVNSAKIIDGLYLSDELLTNPSFESDFTLDGSWQLRNKSEIVRTDEKAQDGKYCVLVTNRPSGWASVNQFTTDKISQYGKGKYRIRAYVMTKDEPCNMNVKLVVTDSSGVRHDSENIQPISNTEWTLVDYIADVDWDYDVTKVEFYVESPSNKGEAWEKQDFYVDNCSLTKLMTADEYEEILTKQIEQKNLETARERAEAEKYAELSEKYKDDAFETYYPAESREILRNPYKGLIIYPGQLEFKGDFSSGASKIGSILYHRYAWCYVEPKEGEFNWDIFDKNIELCKKYGMQFGMALGSTVNYNSTTSYNQDTPEWLFEKGCKYTVENMGDGCVIKVPDYDDPIFKQEMQKMIDAFAERYNDNETIAYVDMRNYGNWGEWHFYQLPVNRDLDAKRTNEQYFEYIDMFKDLRLPTLTFVSKAAVCKHALETFGAGIRADGLVNPNETTQQKTLAIAKNKAMTVGEWFYQYTSTYQPGGKLAYFKDKVPMLYEQQIMDGSISSFAFLNWDADRAYQFWPGFYDRMANLLGYWYKPVKIEHSKDITKGLFRLEIKNDGVAPLFAGYEKKAVVKLALADDSNKILDTVVLEGFDPLYWYAGEYSNCAAEYEFKNTKGAKKLLLGVFTREQNETPNVKLGIKADMVDGWYDISSMARSDDSNLAHNKIYKANSLYADDGYGFRRPEYSCDNDPSTYWANNCVKDNYLEIDFGETKNVSEITLNGVETLKINYSIKGLRNGKWINLTSGISISSLGTQLKFRETQVDKIRFVIDETKEDAVVKISELKVK